MNDLMAAARTAADHAYSPYSGIRVGAACVTEQGELVTGANVENASYGLSLCAERVAIATAIARGNRRIVALAVWSGHGLPWPCGACLQFLNEFSSPDTPIHLGHGESTRVKSLCDLLPSPFRLDTGVRHD